MHLQWILVTKKLIDFNGMILSSLESILDNYVSVIDLVIKLNALPFVLLNGLIGAYDVYQVVIYPVLMIWNRWDIIKFILLSNWNERGSDSILALRIVSTRLLIVNCAFRSLLTWCYTLTHKYLGFLLSV